MSRATVILASDAERKQAARWCMLLPINSRVEFKGVVRTVPQNARLWAMLTEVAIQVKWHGVKLTPDDWKVVFTAALKRELRIVPNIDGNGFVQLGASTSDMSKDEIGELMDLISAFGAREGVTFHEPSDEPDASTKPAEGVAPDIEHKFAEEPRPKRAKKADKPVEADQPQQQDGAEGGAERPAEVVETQAVEGGEGGGEVVAEVVSEVVPAEVVAEEPTPTIAGPAPRGVRYTVASDEWTPGGKPSYLNGVPAGNAGRLAGLPEYEAHPDPIASAPAEPVQAEVAPTTTTQPATIERDALDDLSDAVPHMETWPEIKAAYLGIGRSEAWKKAQVYEQTAVKLTVYQAVIELVAAGKATVTPETDVTFFGIWLQYMTEKAPRPVAADLVQTALDKLVTSDSFGVLTDAWKTALKAKTEATITMLRGA